jgi:tRNA (mo5U34)-methyltransferase
MTDLAARANALHWYHTIELGQGVVTKGNFDTRATVPKVSMPADLSGKRCLDIGTWDGFWAFEMERRGASEVVAIDLDDPGRWDWPPHDRPGMDVLAHIKGGSASFALAKEALGSRVERLDLSVYDLDPTEQGRFDFVFLGSLLLHLRDPLRALAAVRGVCSGEAVIADTVEAIPSLLRRRTPVARLDGLGRPWWWLPNAAGLNRMVLASGFEVLETTGLYYLPLGQAHPRKPLWRHNPFTPGGREEIVVALRGVPHVAVRARVPRNGADAQV